MRSIVLTALSLALLTSSLSALNTPSSSKFDRRVSYATYNADDVFLVKCKNGYVSMLQFADNERIVNIATGFSSGWEIVDKENFLFIKPKAYVINESEQNTPKTMTDSNGDEIDFQMPSVIQPNAKEWNTNLIVTTTNKIYIFDLRLDEENINYRVKFNYPLDEKLKEQNKKQALELAKKQIDEKKELAKDAVETTRFEGQYRVLASVDASLRQSVLFSNTNTFNYYRKSIELGIRQLHVLSDIYHNQSTSNVTLLKT